MSLRAISLAFMMLALVACGGGSQKQAGGVDPATPDAGCEGSCADTPTDLTVADVESVIAQAVAEAQARGANATIAVVDRVGNVLAVFRMNGAAAAVTVASPGPGADGGLEGVSIVPDSMAAISKDWYALRFVKDQTPDMCMTAVAQNGCALEYVKDQTPDLCMATVTQNGQALVYVKNKTPDLRRIAKRKRV